MQTTIGSTKKSPKTKLQTETSLSLDDFKDNAGYKKIMEWQKNGLTEEEIEDIASNCQYLDIIAGNDEKLKSGNIDSLNIFPIIPDGGFGLSLINISGVIDQENITIKAIESPNSKTIRIENIPVAINRDADGKIIKSTKTVNLTVSDDEVFNSLKELASNDSDYFKQNEVSIKNILGFEFITGQACTITKIDKDKNGNYVGLTKDNFDKFFSIKEREVLSEDAKPALFNYNENGKLEIFGTEYSIYDIDKYYQNKLDSVVNPFLYDLVESKLQINDIMLGITTGSLLPNDLKQSASNMIASYKNIFSKYSDNIYFDNKVMTELEKAYNDYSVYLRSFNERQDEASGNEVLAAKMKDFMDKKSAILIEKIESVDSYLQEVSDEEKTALENTVGPNGELRKKIGDVPQNLLRTPTFENLLKFVLDCDKYRDTPILIGHAGIGKTFASKVAAGLMHKPLYQLTGHYDFSLSDLVGTIRQNNKGFFVMSKGPLVKLAETGGVLILDEFNALPQEVMKALNGLLDEIKTGGGGVWNVQIQGQNLSVKVSPDLRIVLTGNPSGYSAEYGNLAGVTTDLSRRTVVRELPPIEIEVKKVGKGDPEISFPMIEAYFSNLDLSTNSYFSRKSPDEAKKYKLSLKKKTNEFLKEMLTLLGKGFIDKTSQVGLDAKNFYVLVNDPGANMDIIESIKNVSMSIPSIVINRLNEIIKYTNGNSTEDITKYLETYIFEAIRSDAQGPIAIKKILESVNR